MILKKIQNTLQNIYRIRIPHNVEDFIVAFSEDSKEEILFIKNSQGEVALGLFVAPPILKRLQRHNPFISIGRHNLEALLIATEGVSHFLYFLKKLEEEKPVTQLELELQAEIDKYLLTSLLYFTLQRSIPVFLFATLFEKIDFADALSKAEKTRYQEANKMATRFCAYLEQNFIRHGRWKRALHAARRFYHLNHWQKLQSLTP